MNTPAPPIVMTTRDMLPEYAEFVRRRAGRYARWLDLDADDIAQETFYYMLRGQRTYTLDPVRCHFYGLVATITLNTAFLLLARRPLVKKLSRLTESPNYESRGGLLDNFPDRPPYEPDSDPLEVARAADRVLALVTTAEQELLRREFGVRGPSNVPTIPMAVLKQKESEIRRIVESVNRAKVGPDVPPVATTEDVVAAVRSACTAETETIQRHWYRWVDGDVIHRRMRNAGRPVGWSELRVLLERLTESGTLIHFGSFYRHAEQERIPLPFGPLSNIERYHQASRAAE